MVLIYLVIFVGSVYIISSLPCLSAGPYDSFDCLPSLFSVCIIKENIKKDANFAILTY